MKVKVLKDYVGRNNGLLHKAGAINEWTTVGKYGRALIDNGFVEVVKGNNEWRLVPGCRYYCPSNPGGMESIWLDDNDDHRRMELGLAFETEEEATCMADWLKAVKVLRRDSERSMGRAKTILPMWFVSQRGSQLAASVYECCPVMDNPFPFSTLGDAEKSIAEHGKEWLTFFKFMSE